MIGKEASVHLIFSMIFNQSCKSEAAFKAPGQLLKRLEMQAFDLRQIEAVGYDTLYAAIAQKPCLHRFPSVMAKYVYNSVLVLNERYDSDPRNIWRGKTDCEIVSELTNLSGIGYHKAVQCLLYLEILMEVSDVPQKYADYMAEKCVGFFDDVDGDLRWITGVTHD